MYSNSRKVKCDRERPHCERCRRGGVDCQYDSSDRVEQDSQGDVTRITNTSEVSSTPPLASLTTSSSRSDKTGPDTRDGRGKEKTSGVDRTFAVLDDISEFGKNARPRFTAHSLPSPSASPAPDPTLWPSILSPQPLHTRSPRWIRDVRENMEALPERALMYVLIDRFFLKVDFFCEYVLCSFGQTSDVM